MTSSVCDSHGSVVPINEQCEDRPGLSGLHSSDNHDADPYGLHSEADSDFHPGNLPPLLTGCSCYCADLFRC